MRFPLLASFAYPGMHPTRGARVRTGTRSVPGNPGTLASTPPVMMIHVPGYPGTRVPGYASRGPFPARNS
eukprot:1050234-Rhodomonas_salina.2